MDYKAAHSILRLSPGQFVYVSRERRTIQWNRAEGEYKVLSASEVKEKCPQDCYRFTTVTPRTLEEFEKSAKAIFPKTAIGIPLRHLYLDCDVHLQKAIEGNITLAIGEVAVAFLDNKGTSAEKKLHVQTAFTRFDQEYSFHYLTLQSLLLPV